MQDTPLVIHHTYRPCAKHSQFFHQSPRHNTMGQQQIIHRIGINLIQTLVYLVGIFNLGNIPRRS